MIPSTSIDNTTAMTTILITGASGQLGRALSLRFHDLAQKPGTQINVLSLDRSQLDLAQPDSVRQTLRRLQPNIIINAAAHTAVDQAELEPALAHAINATGPEVLAEEAKALEATLIHFSTDYVFAGVGRDAYHETDVCAPKSVYGASKLAGEKAIALTGARHLIFRTSWVYAPHGVNFMLTMLKLAKDRETLSVIDDQWGVPTWVGRIVAVTEKAVLRIIAEPEHDLGGIYHLCPRGETTWYRYAAKTFELAPDPDRKLKTLVPISSAQYEANLRSGNPSRIVAQRPNNSRMNCQKLEEVFQLELPQWEDDLKLCLNASVSSG
jgi:dTDP-4-dehydrorhamnose reductase